MKVNELNFKPHSSGIGGTRATHMFDNGFGVSVVSGSMFFTSDAAPYEIAILDKDGITYETPITDDVLGYLTESDANEVLKQVEELA